MSDRLIDPETGNLASVRDVAEYGVSILPANVLPGTRYWRISDVYHLAGKENKGNHNVYVDMLNADGTRRNGARCSLYFGSDRNAVLANPPRSVLTVDKPANEPGTNAPLFRGNYYAVEGMDMPSDKAVGFNSEWPDEEAGNTNGHHSFMVVFRETTATSDAPSGNLRGIVNNGTGRTVMLTGSNLSLSAVAGADGTFSFESLPPGTYSVTVEGASVVTTVVVSAGQIASVTLSVPVAGDSGDMQRQIAELQDQVSQLTAERDRYRDALTQIKQSIGNAGL